MENRKIISSGAPWEDLAGYARAVRVGHTIEVSGTVAQEQGNAVGKGDPYTQTSRILEIIVHAIEQAGGQKEDIVRTRIYVVDIRKDWKDVARAHGDFFSQIKPATSMIEVSALISPEYLVEIEATAIVQ